MQSRYDEAEARKFVEWYGARFGEDLALRVYTSRLLGADPSLVLHGGGNTSVKSTAHEITGEAVDVLYVKGSGWDLSTIEPPGFPACRLAALRRACDLEEMTDEAMVALLRSQMLDPASPTPSVEALLHAFLPGKFVDHTHADAVLSVVDQPDGEQRAREIWPEGMLFVPYVMPGFLLARRIVELAAELSEARLMVLDKHGIFTWGETARDSYEAMIDAVTAAERYIDKNSSGSSSTVRFVGPAPERAERHRRQIELSPLIRGAVERAADGQKFICEWRDDLEILDLAGREDAEQVTQIGTATPDHVIRTKPFPVWLGSLEGESEEQIRQTVFRKLSVFCEFYERYFEENATRYDRDLTRLDRLPRLLLVRGLGVLSLGKSLKEARVAGDIYAHTAAVIRNANAIGTYRPVSLADLFDVEYWSLEQAKLKKNKGNAGPLARHIALVTGAAHGIGRATAETLLNLGAHVMLSDHDASGLADAVEQLGQDFGPQVAATTADVTRSDDVARLVNETARTFGGLDVLVSNAGNAPSGLIYTTEGDEALRTSLELNLLAHQRIASAAVQVMLRQNTGGCLLFNASKSAFNPGKEFGPYAVPKAGLVALMRQYAVDLGAHGIRSNAVNADRIRTQLFDEALIEARAKARGVSKDAYFSQNLLGRETTADDVASAFGYLATARATTGCVLTVDGGNAAAFPR